MEESREGSGSADDKYIIHPKKDTDSKSMWPHYLISKDRLTAKCKHCQKVICIKGGSTKGLHVHFLTRHSLTSTSKPTTTVGKTNVGASASSSCFIPPAKKQKQTLHDYFAAPNENTLDAVISRMTALDGLPFRVFVSSSDLRKALEARGFTDVPTSATTVCSRVLAYQKKIINNYIQELSGLKKNGNSFSLTLDEWTSTANKRYMNVNLHGMNKDSKEKIWNLGLVRIKGSLPAEGCAVLVTERLENFP